MNRYAVQLISRGAVNKIGNMLYDYGNSVWLASMGTIGQTVLGMYQISELVTSILVNPFWRSHFRPFFSVVDFNDDGPCLWYSLSSYFFYKE